MDICNKIIKKSTNTRINTPKTLNDIRLYSISLPGLAQNRKFRLVTARI